MARPCTTWVRKWVRVGLCVVRGYYINWRNDIPREWIEDTREVALHDSTLECHIYLSLAILPFTPSVCLGICLSVLSVCLSVFLPVHRLISYLCVYVSLLLVCVYYLCQLSVSPYVCSAVCLFASPSIHLYAYMFVYRSSIMSANMNVFFAACVYMYVPSVCLCVWHCPCVPVCLYVCLPACVCMPVRFSVYNSILT